MTKAFKAEVAAGKRFEFGKNWQRFLGTLTAEQVRMAEDSIKTMLGIDTLEGKTVVDIGSGSGLFSLAARNLGARVHSFDYDPTSVTCTRDLRARYRPDDPNWAIDEGSILDVDFLKTLGTFDLVYSWGVLHHTGALWTALENAAALVAPGGTLFVAIYNDQGRKSASWRRIKEIYCSGPAGRAAVCVLFIPYFAIRALVGSAIRRRNLFTTYRDQRGMSMVRDWIDWLGGLPFEVASVDEVFRFLRARGFWLTNIRTAKGGWGNNQFVFARGWEGSSRSSSRPTAASTA